MISPDELHIVNDRFRNYLGSLKIEDKMIREHVDFKIEHTYRVVSNMGYIARKTDLSVSDIRLAEIIALVHDIGRFQQFMTYKTFDDSISVNHAALGVRIMHETDIFGNILDNTDRSLIVRAVMNHNVARLRRIDDPRVLLFSRMIRDADKLDIWEILTFKDVVFRILDEQKPEISYEVPQKILNCFRSQQTVPSGFAVTLNDYRLLRLSWIYDMNFAPTYELIIERNYADKILAKIPPSDELDEIAGIIRHYVAEQETILQQNPR